MTTDTPTLRQLREQRDAILSLAARYHAYNVRVFGSVARGDAHPTSDIDFLVDLHTGATMFDLVGLWLRLEEMLGRPVNVVAEEAPRDEFMHSVLRDARPL